MFVQLLQLNLIGLLLTISSSCVSFPEPPEQRGACVVTFPDREDICLEVPQQACLAAMGEYYGDGSTCDALSPVFLPDLVEPSPLYLDQKVIYSVGGTLTAVFAAWVANRRRKRGKANAR